MGFCESNNETLGSNNSGQFLGRLAVSEIGPCFKELVDYCYKVLRLGSGRQSAICRGIEL